MKDFEDLVRKSVALDPWVKDRGIRGYIEELESEIYEVKEALDKKDHDNLVEELGDVLMDWFHLCILAEEKGLLKFDEIEKIASDKLTRRKPYILENKQVTKEEAREIWMKVKEEEKCKKS